jgi:large subunit ribosomal protein L20
MARVKRGITTKRRHKKMLALTKGFKWLRKNCFKMAKQAAMKAGTNAYRGRKMKKRDFRGLWIQRINAAVRAQGMVYSQFIYKMQNAHVRLNRKVLADLAGQHPEVFSAVVNQVR